MKRAIALLVLGLVAAAAAQKFPTDKGSMMLGGSAYYLLESGKMHENEDGDKYSAFSLSPHVDYFISPGLAVGGTVSIGHSAQGDNSSSWLGIGPEVYYFIGGDVKPNPIKGKPLPFVTACYSFYNATDKSKYDGETSEFKRKYTDLSVGAGMMVMLSNAVALDARLTYLMQTAKYGDAENNKGNEIELSFGFSAFTY
jgi:hypothetical protein